jgi:hypothetical protein
MCCFSRPVDSVTNTNIFARASAPGRQFLAYEMTLSAKEDLAMILPLPVPGECAEDAVKFVDLEGYPAFFKDLKSGFPEPASRALGGPAAAEGKAKPLAVVEVGSFEASFVPTVKDFARLDERFRLPDAAWESLPGYQDFGFAVFKLKQGAKTIHPMAFEFPRKDPKRLFFPTVHIHDGKVHATATFDHSLYCQRQDGDKLDVTAWQESPKLAGSFVVKGKDGGLVDPARHVHRRTIRGKQKNEDVVL